MRTEPHQLDREKLKEAVLLIASHCPAEELGNVKLHKILYFSDMLHFLQEGSPLTGVDYLKQKFGPVARNLSATLGALEKEGRIKVEEQEYYGLYKKSYLTTAPYKRDRLSENEVNLIIEVAEYVRGKSAREISELSHNAAWEAMELGETIPYFTALRLQPVEINESDRRWAADSAREHAAQPLS